MAKTNYIRLRALGMTCQEIANRYGVSRQVVHAVTNYRKRGGKRQNQIKEMKIGSFVTIKGDNLKRARSGIHSASKKLGYQIITKIIGDELLIIRIK